MYYGFRTRWAGVGIKLSLLGDNAAHTALDQSLELHRARRQVLDADGGLTRVHVGKRRHWVHSEFHLSNTHKCLHSVPVVDPELLVEMHI